MDSPLVLGRKAVDQGSMPCPFPPSDSLRAGVQEHVETPRFEQVQGVWGWGPAATWASDTADLDLLMAQEGSYFEMGISVLTLGKKRNPKSRLGIGVNPNHDQH